MEESILKDFIITRRDQFRSFESGEISFSELITYIWLCYIADSYGYAHVRSYGWFAERLPIDVKGNTVGVIMRSLRNHKLIDYSDRQGSRSGFKVTIGYWPIGKGKFRQLGKNEDCESADSAITKTVNESHLIEEVASENHKLPTLLNSAKTVEKMASIRNLLTSHNIDMEKKKEKENESSKSLSFKKKDFRVSVFRPDSYEEQQCLDLAIAIGDEEVGFMLGIYRKYGFTPLIRAKGEFDKVHGIKKDNPPAFFNSLVQQQLESQLI